MKKIVLITVLLAMLSFTACEKDTLNPPEITFPTETDIKSAVSETVSVSNETVVSSSENVEIIPKAQIFVDMVNNKKVYFKCTITDSMSSVDTITAYDGINVYSDQDFGGGLRITSLTNENGFYSIDTVQKMYLKMSDENLIEVSSQDFVSSNDEYDEYKTTDGSIYRYFVKDGILVKADVITSENEKISIIYQEFTDQIPDGIFNLPEGYTEYSVQ